MKENKCIVCNSKNSLYFLNKDNFNLYKCKNCALVYAYPQPSLKELIKDYYSGVKRSRKNRKFIKILDELSKFKTKGNLLDVGCSTGEFLLASKERGFNGYGVEVDKEAAEIANSNGLNIFVGVLENADFQDNYFSVIHLGDVIEHVPDPVALLKECKRILKEDGIIIISTPNLNCFWSKATHLLYKWFNFPWSTAVPPYHLFLFSDSNFNKLLYEIKFRILGTQYHRCSLKHELGGTGLFRRERHFYTLLVFSAYVFVYLTDYIITPFKKKDFEMIVFAQNNL